MHKYQREWMCDEVRRITNLRLGKVMSEFLSSAQSLKNPYSAYLEEVARDKTAAQAIMLQIAARINDKTRVTVSGPSDAQSISCCIDAGSVMNLTGGPLLKNVLEEYLAKYNAARDRRTGAESAIRAENDRLIATIMTAGCAADVLKLFEAYKAKEQEC